MLPDYLRVKKRLHELYMERWYRMAASDGVLGGLPEPQTLHEGDRHHLVREDGSEQDVEMKQGSASMSFHFDELDSATTEEIVRKWDAAARDMHGQMTKHLIEVVDQGCEEVGNVFDAKGRPFAEVFLEMMEKMDMSFEPDGTRSPGQSVLLHPSTFERIRPELEAMEADPDIQRRVREIENRKREEWRAREADRKLVG